MSWSGQDMPGGFGKYAPGDEELARLGGEASATRKGLWAQPRAVHGIGGTGQIFRRKSRESLLGTLACLSGAQSMAPHLSAVGW